MYEPQRGGLVIKPMGVGGVLDAGIRLARQNYQLLVMTSARIVIPFFILAAILDLTSRTAVLSGFILSVGTAFASIALVIACARLIEPNNHAVILEPGALYRAALQRVWPAILLGLIIIILFIPLSVLFPIGIYLGVRWSMSWVALVVERIGPIEAMRRSWHLTRHAWWHTLGVGIVAVILILVLSLIVSGVLGAIGGILAFSTGKVGLGLLFSSLGSAAAQIFVSPVSTAISVVLYYELRARSGGLDLPFSANQLPPNA